ncbi:DUF86 domain-containing protein [Candidatus Kaiserbacteria bacterium]|nr:DUF86 domain-containing protein [Candidatus Kaiserbacteria bacterium]
MISHEVVINKLVAVKDYLGELQPLLQRESREIIDDSVVLHAIERLFQLIVDTSIDINTYIIGESGFNVPEDYQSTFITLGEHGVIPTDFARKIAPSVGLRNQIVHKYGKVDLKFMVDQIKGEIGDYAQYLKHIDEFLKK